MKKKKISLDLNKEVIDQLDKAQLMNINGGEVFLTLWGSNCNNSDPNAHQCCAPIPTQDAGACVSHGTVTDVTTPGSPCADCTPS